MMNCRGCKDKKCKYKGLGIEEYTIICKEGCTKQIKEEIKNIAESEFFIKLLEEVKDMNCSSKPALLFVKRLEEVLKLNNNGLVQM